MRYLLNSFVGFGCLNGESLAVIVEWLGSDIDDFLNRMVACNLPVHGSSMLSEMELWVLKKCFKSIFSDSQGGEKTP